VSADNERQQQQTERLRSRRAAGLIVVAAALLLSAVGAAMSSTAFWSGYLVAVLFWVGATLGCLGISLIHVLTGGRWGHAIARNLRAGMGTLPLGVVASLPLWWTAAALYPGAGPAADEILNAQQRLYFARSSLLERALLYLLVWGGLSVWMIVSYRRQNLGHGGHPAPRKAAIGLVLLWLSISFAAVDWVMSLTPHWTSTILPMMEVVGFGMTGLAIMIVTNASYERDPRDEAVQSQSHDLGNLLLAFNFLWVYLAFSQYIIIWSGDIAEEVVWYADRKGPAGIAVAVVLALMHFVIPFGLLLSRPLKRDVRKLARIALLLLTAHLLTLGWEILPAIDTNMVWAAGLTVSNAVVIGALWLALFRAIYARLPADRSLAQHVETTDAHNHGWEGSP